MNEIDLTARPRLQDLFSSMRCGYPPEQLALLVLKKERRLEVWTTDKEGAPCLVKEYPILAASGATGPKLKKGDRQVPEGIYSIVELNPYSRFHLSMKLDYPNKFDRAMAKRDGRSCLGDNIYIHGSFISKGCIAVGDEGIEELYQMVGDAGKDRVRVIIAPYDFRVRPEPPRPAVDSPKWVPELYKAIEQNMSRYIRVDAGVRESVVSSR